MLEINSTVIIQIINFLVLLFLMNLILYRPIRGIITRRDDEMESLQGAIADYGDRADSNEKGIEEGMILARKEGFAEKERIKGEGLDEEKGILQQAGSAVEDKLGKAKSEMDDKIADVRKSLEDQISGFSEELASKILGRSIQ